MSDSKVQAPRETQDDDPIRSPMRAYLRRLTRPIEFAVRDANRPAMIQNLGAFLAQCAKDGLSVPTLRPIHHELRRLQRLADGYDRLPVPARRRRLDEVWKVVQRAASIPAAPADTTRPRPTPRTAAPAAVELSQPVTDLPGVGPRRAAVLGRLGIERVEDVLWRLPWRYVDRATTTPIGSLRAGQEATVCGRIVAVDDVVTARRRMRILRAVLADTTGSVTLKWFNQTYLRTQLAVGQILMCSGRIRSTQLPIAVELHNPQFEPLTGDIHDSLHTGRVVPIYHETKGVNSRALRVLVNHALASSAEAITETLPQSVITKHGLMARSAAFRAAHFPPSDAEIGRWNEGVSPAHRRLVFEELFLLELGLAVRRLETSSDSKGVAFRCMPDRLSALFASLPFEPTAAQRRVIGEMCRDMAQPLPMNRLIQGDVGCGKTLIAAAAIWVAAGDGYQSALMAPTELLAEQHGRAIVNLLGRLGLRVVVLTSEVGRRERSDVLGRLAAGTVDCIVGTHSLLQPDVRFARFGLAVVDEQHKFGVVQRSHLVRKGYHPDVLIMTATPIPRTLAMTVYGDLDVSVIDEMPVGRVPIITRWWKESARAKAHECLRHALEGRKQAYVVAPRIEDEDEEERRSVGAAAERLQRAGFPERRIGVLHGRLSRSEKDDTMRRFVAHDLDILVSTTVIEVGIDVPNATVMVIEHADRYGLAQLHQLRGRVGRGSDASICVLMSPDRVSEDAEVRLRTMVETNDGFVIAERDLEARGPGEVLGTRQSGLPDLKVANLIRDVRLVAAAREEAFALVQSDPSLARPEHRETREALRRTWGSRLTLASVG